MILLRRAYICIIAASAVLGLVNAHPHSHVNKQILSKLVESRSLEEDQEQDASFVADYSLTFQGCHELVQWNANDGEGNKVITKRLARFRLCPSGYCDGGACSSDAYGEYILDLATYAEAWLEYLNQENGDNGDNENENFDPQEYLECGEYGNYYVGPYCSEQGGDVRFGVFSDEYCTTLSEGMDFYELTGYSLPYNGESLIPTDTCSSCVDNDNNNNGDGNAEPNEFCERTYEDAGKCETNMDVAYPNEYGCSYLEEVMAEMNSGSIVSKSGGGLSTGVLTAIIVFASLAVLLAVYVFFLRNKLGRAQVKLNDDEPSGAIA